MKSGEFLTVFCLLLGHGVCDRGQFYKQYRLESLCNSDNGKVRLRMGDLAATFQLNSSLVPGQVFNCHLELALDSSSFGFFVFFESMLLSASKECEEDYVQFGRDILFITSFRSKKFCGVINCSLPMVNKTMNKELPGSVTPMSKRIYSESSDQEMDIWVKMTVPSSMASQKTLSFVVTPFKKVCSSANTSYQKCGKSGRCVRAHLFCDGTVNCAIPSDTPTDETICKPISSIPDVDKSNWQEDHFLLIIVIPLALILLLVLFLAFWRKRAVLLNLPKAGSTTSGASRRYPPELIDLDYHSGHIVPVPRTAPPVPSRHAPNAPPLPPLPPAYNDIIDNTAAENAQPL